MKKILSAMFVCLSISLSAQTVKGVVNEGLRYCESTYPYQEGILVANFGTAELNPLNTEGKGYIAFYKNGKTQVMVPADGNLSAPKGMFIRQDYLYVCDVNKIVVYHLTDKAEKPKVISLPEGNLFVNDLAADGNYLYASVTNTDRIFRLDISNPAQPGQPEEWLQISGPNGLLVRDGMMYVASYPADGVTKEANVIYRIDNLKQPVARKLTEVTGQYDGIAFSSDGKSLIVTNWTPAQLSRIDLASGKMSPLPLKLEQPLIGPADITVKDGFIYIPDLPNSRVVVVKESCCCKSHEGNCGIIATKERQPFSPERLQCISGRKGWMSACARFPISTLRNWQKRISCCRDAGPAVISSSDSTRTGNGKPAADEWQEKCLLIARCFLPPINSGREACSGT